VALLEFNLTSIVMLLEFILLAFFLYKFLYKPYLNMTSERKNKIKADLDAAEKAKDAAEGLKEKNRLQLEETRAAIEKMMNSAKKNADVYQSEEREKVRIQVERITLTAKTEIERMKTEAVDNINNEIVKISVLIASKLLEKQIDEKIQKEFVFSMLKKIREEE